jgi:hypothetical protein
MTELTRQEVHDLVQAKRQTREQLLAVIDLISDELRNGDDKMWFYEDLPPQGGVLTLGIVGCKQWTVKPDGTVTEVALDN